MKIVLTLPDSCPDTEVSIPFMQGQVDRMAMSYHKYGAVADAKGKVDEVQTLLLRLAKYAGTNAVREAVEGLPELPKSGNTEFMMDVANFAMIEYMHRGPRKFKATDSKESPGRVIMPTDEFDNVEISQRANDGSIFVDDRKAA